MCRVALGLSRAKARQIMRSQARVPNALRKRIHPVEPSLLGHGHVCLFGLFLSTRDRSWSTCMWVTAMLYPLFMMLSIHEQCLRRTHVDNRSTTLEFQQSLTICPHIPYSWKTAACSSFRCLCKHVVVPVNQFCPRKLAKVALRKTKRVQAKTQVAKALRTGVAKSTTRLELEQNLDRF